ncbi:MAG: hypothetical protein O6918_00740 [Deltaproteobacteria bacterium]|nr:hypothetical protein [Deltaproteobacteria bacterium]
MRDLVEGVLEDGGSRKSLAGSRRESSKRGRVGDQELAVVLECNERGTAKLYLLELDRTVILSNAVFTRRQKQSEELTAHLAVGCNTL